MKKTAHQWVRELLTGSKVWLAAYEIQGMIVAGGGKLYSESGLTARVRDLRKEKYGGYPVQHRTRKGLDVGEYRIGTDA